MPVPEPSRPASPMIVPRMPRTRPATRTTLLSAIGLSGVVLLAAGLLARHGRVPAFDRALTARLVQAKDSGLFRLGDLVSTVSSGPVAAALAVAFGAWIWWRHRDIVVAAITPAAGALGAVTELIGKSVVGRLRPPTAVLTGESGNGFPSGHTTGFTALVVGAVFTLVLVGINTRARRLAWLVATVSSVVVAVGRVLVGAHYALDTIAGLALGALCALVTVFVASVPAVVRVGQRVDGQVRSRLGSGQRRRSSARSV